MNSSPTQNLSNSVNWLKERPITHRGLHDPKKGIYENTLSAAKAACDAGYPIEVDLQLSSDFVPMVFHDLELSRMTNLKGNIRDLSHKEIEKITIMDTDDHIPTLEALLNLIQGKVGIVLELKGKSGSDEGFIQAVSDALDGYEGNITIMSFSHQLLMDARKIAPHLSLGLTAEGDDTRYEAHRKIANLVNIDFISYELKNLDCKFVYEISRSGEPAISWTVKSEKEAEYSAQFVDQITFEGFLA